MIEKILVIFCTLNATITLYSSRGFIKIEEFNRTVLKKDVNQEITEEWYIYEVNILGDLNSLVNGIDLANDVMKYSSPLNNISAVKSFESALIHNLNCQNGCKLMDVDIGQWIGRVALSGGNYTIQGTTVIEAPISYYNLK